MRNLRITSEEKRIALICKILTFALFIGYAIFFTILFHRQYWLGSPYQYSADLHTHIAFSRLGKNMYSLTYYLLGFADKLVHRGGVTCIMLTSFLLLGIVASKVLLQHLMPKVNRWIVWVFAFLANMFFTFNLTYIPHIGSLDVRGMLNFNVYHNPTYIMMKPFAIFSVWFFLRLMNKYTEKGIKVSEWFIFSGLMLLTTLFKPNFMIGFSVSMLCVLIFDFIRHRGKIFLRCVALGTTVFPSLAVMLYQQITLFGADTDSKMQIGFMVGLRAMAYHPGFKILLSMVFPIVILAFVFKDLLKDRKYTFGWLHMIINLGITCFVYETGHRLSHGNFLWSSFFAIGILFIVSIAKYVEIARERRIGALALSSGVLGVHVFSWMNYVGVLIQGGLGY